ncbi:MAG: hypothetical protein KAT88_07245 [Spirochaetes bacterium]|nr:hypothetical protein [Spirochaetota bacterium]
MIKDWYSFPAKATSGLLLESAQPSSLIPSGEKKVNIEAIRDLLGHENCETTLVSFFLFFSVLDLQHRFFIKYWYFVPEFITVD